jgi:hypothetical protein
VLVIDVGDRIDEGAFASRALEEVVREEVL